MKTTHSLHYAKWDKTETIACEAWIKTQESQEIKRKRERGREREKERGRRERKEIERETGLLQRKQFVL